MAKRYGVTNPILLTLLYPADPFVRLGRLALDRVRSFAWKARA